MNKIFKFESLDSGHIGNLDQKIKKFCIFKVIFRLKKRQNSFNWNKMDSYLHGPQFLLSNNSIPQSQFTGHVRVFSVFFSVLRNL